jgi:hypothetical protein
MLDKRSVRLDLTSFSRALSLAVALGVSAALTGCADIHPAPDDQDEGMLESPTDEADQFRRAEERDQGERDPGEGRRQ